MAPRLSTPVCLVAGVLVLFVSCGRAPSKPASPEAVAIVGDSLITVAQFNEALGRRPWCVTLEQRKALLEELVRQEILFLRAQRAGYDQDPELRAAVRQMMATRYEEDQWKLRPELPAVTDQEIQQYYQTNISQFSSPERVRIAMVLVKVPGSASAEKRDELRQNAEMILAEARQLPASDWSFGPVALKHSEDQATRYIGGDCGWVSRSQRHPAWDQAVFDAMFALKTPGDLSRPLPGKEGYYLLKLMDRKPAAPQPLERVRDAIAYQLRRQREQQQREEFERQQRAGLRVEVHAERLASGLDSSALVAQTPRDPPRMPVR